MSSLKGKTLLNQYHVEEFIATTPLGELYRATDTRNNNLLALTILPKPIADNGEAIKEIDLASNKLRGISHPNIVSYLGLFQSPTSAFILEEWMEGPSLRDILQRAPLTTNETLFYIKSLCNALDELHKQNFAHTHLAPELIRINQRGVVLLGGIGAAQNLGSFFLRAFNKNPRLYLAPEQFNAQSVTPATDTYALAVIAYELATNAWINGRSAPKTSEAIRRAHLELQPPAPASINAQIPDHFSRMILWALRKNPDERLRTATELISSLALGAKINADEIPLHAAPKQTPVTLAALNLWHFPAPLAPPLLAQDTALLDERLASIVTPKPVQIKRRIGFAPIFALILILGFASIFWFVRPAPAEIATPEKITAIPTSEVTSMPAISPTPQPTDPHGGRIVFTCTRGEYNQLCMVNRDGTGLAQLSNLKSSNYYPTFMQDGMGLLFASNRNGPFDLYLLSFGKKELIQLTSNIGNVISPDYSPDGRSIVFANRVGDGTTAIWAMNADGLNPRLLYTGVDDIVAVAWSPNGERIAYAMSIGVPQEYEIFVMDANGKNHTRLTENLNGIGGSLDWSPDGKFLLIYAGAFGDKDIYKLDVENGNAIQLTNGGNNAGASYSPDGLYIVFNSLRNEEQADLYIMRSNGENQVQLTNHPEPDWGPKWTR